MKSTPVAICLEPYGGIFHEQRILRLQDAYFGHCTDVVRSSIATQSPCSMKSPVLARSLSFFPGMFTWGTYDSREGGRYFFQATNQPTLFSTQFFATSLKSSQNSCKRHRHPGIRWDFLKFLQDSVIFWTNQIQTLAESEFQ